VTNVSPHGFWLLVDERELFVAFKDFPWFQDASIKALGAVKRPNRNHLYWPSLDIDLALDSIEHPDRYPLVSRAPAARVSERKPRRSTKKQTKHL
jgi:hypothetical protein